MKKKKDGILIKMDSIFDGIVLIITKILITYFTLSKKIIGLLYNYHLFLIQLFLMQFLINQVLSQQCN